MDCMRKQDDYQEFIQFCDNVAANPELAAEIIRKTGVYTKKGRLSKPYHNSLCIKEETN
jgi:hypothetical protein